MSPAASISLFPLASLLPSGDVDVTGIRPSPASSEDAAILGNVPDSQPMMIGVAGSKPSVGRPAGLTAPLTPSKPRKVGETFELDVAQVRRSRLANRDLRYIAGAEFDELVSSIQEHGGNLQAALVRAVPSPDGVVQYELISGHRRLAACELSSMPIKVELIEGSDAQCVAIMAGENQGRQGLSPWERGCWLQTVMAAIPGISQNRAGALTGVDTGTASRVLALAALPEWLIDALDSPTKLQLRDGEAFKSAIATSEQPLKEALSAAGRVSRTELMRLVSKFEGGTGSASTPSPQTVAIRDGDREIGRIVISRRRCKVQMRFDLSEGSLAEVSEKVSQAMQSLLKQKPLTASAQSEESGDE